VSRRWWQGRNPGPPANLPARLPLAVLANHPQRRPAGRPGTRWPSVRSNCMLASPSALSKSAEQRSISIFRPPLSISYYIVRPSRSIVTACRPYACMSDVTNLNSDDHARLWAGTGSAQSEKERTWQTVPNSYLPLNSTTAHHCSSHLKRRKLRSSLYPLTTTNS
jgi:hypothetical protein